MSDHCPSCDGTERICRCEFESLRREVADLREAVELAKKLRARYEEIIEEEWGPFGGPRADEACRAFDSAVAKVKT